MQQRYNGACEAGIGAAKRRSEYLAARQGRYLDWSAHDLEAALLWANEALPARLGRGHGGGPLRSPRRHRAN